MLDETSKYQIMRRQEIMVRATGRGRAARPRTATLTLPQNQDELQPMQQPTGGPNVGQGPVPVAAIPAALRSVEAVPQAPAELPADLHLHAVESPADLCGPLVRSVPRPERRKPR
ncbi:hypothetical protein [Krasilnikovia sp. MM14-A1259]|uniref:hypothetical protein n=1 Tax=Krasilnikovia sp. MM14-A1259 TaxID=3373539 RepID=UPI003811CDF3